MLTYPSDIVKNTFILHRAILVSSDMRYARKVELAFIVSTISRLQS